MPGLLTRMVLVMVLGAALFPATAARCDNQTETDPFESLRSRFTLISQSITNRGGIAEQDKPAIMSLREQARQFAAAHPDDARPWALVAQVSAWLDDNASLDEAYERLSALRPDDVGLAVFAARRLVGRSQYEPAIARLERFGDALQRNIPAAQLLAQCYYASNRFDDAVAILKSIPEEVLAEKPGDAAVMRPDLVKYEQYVSFWNTEQELRAAEAEKDDLPRVQLITTDGPIVVELFEDSVPNTVANFISLVDNGFYNGIAFHRVVPDFMSQVGDPRSRKDAPAEIDGPGYRIADESLGTDLERKHFAGSLSMANKSRKDTGGSQFFLCHKPPEWLNGRHVVFGRIIEGLDIARGLTQAEDMIITAIVLRKRDHAYEPTIIEEPAPAITPGLPPGINIVPTPTTTPPTTGIDDTE